MNKQDSPKKNIQIKFDFIEDPDGRWDQIFEILEKIINEQINKYDEK